jgi:hypothetical protein
VIFNTTVMVSRLLQDRCISLVNRRSHVSAAFRANVALLRIVAIAGQFHCTAVTKAATSYNFLSATKGIIDIEQHRRATCDVICRYSFVTYPKMDFLEIE